LPDTSDAAHRSDNDPDAIAFAKILAGMHGKAGFQSSVYGTELAVRHEYWDTIKADKVLYARSH